MRGGARPGSGRKPAPFDHKRAIKLKEQKLTYDQIANRFGVSVHAIKWFFRKQREKTPYAKNQGNS
jgi:DNA invertase Pin-like site-specific DNA recombinase